MIEAPEIFARIYARHGHRCPMSTLGGRFGLAALAALSSPDAELTAVYHNRTCALDGIALTTGCSEENGSLKVTTEGRHVLEIFFSSGEVVEVGLSDNAMQIAGEYRYLSNELEKGWESLSDQERSEREQQKELALDRILPALWQAPDEDLLTIRVGKGAL